MTPYPHSLTHSPTHINIYKLSCTIISLIVGYSMGPQAWGEDNSPFSGGDKDLPRGATNSSASGSGSGSNNGSGRGGSYILFENDTVTFPRRKHSL